MTRKILMESDWDFYYPEMSFHEIRKHKELVLRKSDMSIGQYTQVLNLLLNHITLVPNEIVSINLKKASLVLAEVDPDDVVFLSTAMGIDGAKIWSDDKHFEHQDKIRVLKSKDVVSLFLQG